MFVLNRNIQGFVSKGKKNNQKSINDPNAKRQLPHVLSYMCTFVYWEEVVERDS